MSIRVKFRKGGSISGVEAKLGRHVLNHFADPCNYLGLPETHIEKGFVFSKTNFIFFLKKLKNQWGTII